MRVIESAIKYPITVAVGVIISLMSGLLVFSQVPVQMTPSVDSVYVTVNTFWENASPKQVESDIISEQEQVLGNLSGLETMTSTSMSNRGTISLEFKSGIDINIAMQKVLQKLDEVPQYPEGVLQPVVSPVDPAKVVTVAWAALASSDPQFDSTTLYSFMERRLLPRLERIEGVSKVSAIGARDTELSIWVNPQAMANLGLSFDQLLAALKLNNQSFSGGLLPDGKSDVLVQTTGRYQDIESVENLVVKRTDSGIVRVRDFAKVQITFKEANDWVRVRGKKMPMFGMELQQGANLLQTMEEIKAELRELNSTDGLLARKAKELGINGKLELVQTYDTSLYVQNAVSLVKSNIIIGGILAVMTLLLFMRSLSAIGVIAIAIPVSVVASIVVLVSFGRSINIVSLSGMAFAVGMVIDNAIVVLENIYRHIEMGDHPSEAAAKGTKQISPAIFASTLTTIAVFIPILFIQDSAGQLFKDIALAIMAAVGVSFIVSVIVIPAAATRMLGNKQAPSKMESFTKVERVITALPLQAAALVKRLLVSWKTCVCVMGFFFVVTCTGIKLLIPPMDYLPSGNFNAALGIMIPPPNYNSEKLTEIAERIDDKLRPSWMAGGAKFAREAEFNNGENKVEPVNMQINGKTVEAPAIAQYFLVSWNGQLIQFAMPEEDDRTVDLVQLMQGSVASAQVPDVMNFAFQLPLFNTAGNTGSAISINILGDDLDLVNANATALMQVLREKYGPYSVVPEPANFSSPGLGLKLTPNEERLSAFGLTNKDLGLAIAANGDGVLIQRSFEVGGELKDIKILTEQAVDDNPMDALLQAPLTTPSGRVIDILNVAKVERTYSAAKIRHVDRLRAVTLQFTPPKGVPVDAAIAEINSMIKSLRDTAGLDDSIDLSLSGSAGKLNDIKRELVGDGSFWGLITSSLFLALLFVFLMLVVLFQHWLYPLVIMLTVPLSTLGGFIGLSIVHNLSVANRYQPIQNMDVLTILGFVILAGVVVNNAILIVHQALNFLADKKQQLNPNQAIIESVKTRVRPILMSTLTSVGGMFPLVLMPGAGSELYRGVGAVVVGGLILSTVFTLFLVPVVLSCIFTLSEKLALLRPESTNQTNPDS